MMARIGRKSGFSARIGWVLAAMAVLGAGITYLWSRELAGKWMGDFIYPFAAIPAETMRAVREEGLSVRSPGELASAVEILRRDNLLLAARTREVAELEAEVAALRALHDLPPSPQYRYLTGEVIRRDPVNWEESFSIDLGSDDGVDPGAAVFTIARDGEQPTAVLAGIIRQVSRHQSVVRSVLNSELRFSVRLPESDAVGFMNTDGSAGSIGFLPSNRAYRIGEPVVTTGFEKSIPGGVSVGRLAELEPADAVFGSRSIRSGTVAVAADLNTLRYVAVAVRIKTGDAGESDADVGPETESGEEPSREGELTWR